MGLLDYGAGNLRSAAKALEAAGAGAVCVTADPRGEALAYAADIAGKNPHAIRAAKRLLNLPAGGIRC